MCEEGDEAGPEEAAKPPLSDEKLIELLIDQRNEHINRLFSLNGQVAILILTLSVTILFGVVSGIDKLHEIAEPNAICLGLAGFLFLSSVVLIALALVHHGSDRALAAQSLEVAIHALIDGQSRHETLEKLRTDMSERVHPTRKKGEEIYLASELNSRWYTKPRRWLPLPRGFHILSLYHKTFIGCLSLLLASLACALAVVTSTPKEKKASDDRLQISGTLNVETPGGFRDQSATSGSELRSERIHEHDAALDARGDGVE